MNQHRTLSWTLLLLAAYSSSTIAGGLVGGQLHALGQRTGSAQPSRPTEPASNAGAINDTLAHPQIQAALIGQDMNAYKNTLNGLFEDKSVWENSFARILRVIRAHPIDTAKKTSALAQYLLAKLEALSPHNQNDKALAAALAITLNSEPNQRFMVQKDIRELYAALCNLAGTVSLKVDSETPVHPQSSKPTLDENKENIENGAKSEKELAAEQERKKIEDEQALKNAHANNANQAMIQKFDEKSKTHDFTATRPEVTPEMQFEAALAQKQLKEKLEAERKVREEEARKIEAEKQAELEKASADAEAANLLAEEEKAKAVEEAGKQNTLSAFQIARQREQEAKEKEVLLATQKGAPKKVGRLSIAPSGIVAAPGQDAKGASKKVGRLSIEQSGIAAASGQDASQAPVTKQPRVISESMKKLQANVNLDALKVGNGQGPAKSTKKAEPDGKNTVRPEPRKLFTGTTASPDEQANREFADKLNEHLNARNGQGSKKTEPNGKSVLPKPGKLGDLSDSAVGKMLANRPKADNGQQPAKSSKKTGPAPASSQPQSKQNKSKLNHALPPRLPVPQASGINMQPTAPAPVATIPQAPAAPRLPVRPPVPYAPGLPVVDNAAGYMLNEGSIDPSNSPRDRTHSTFMSEKLTAQIIADAKKWGIVKKIGKYTAIGSAATGTALGLTWLMKYLKAKWAAMQMASAVSAEPQPDLLTTTTGQEKLDTAGLETPTGDDSNKKLSLDENTNIHASAAAA